MGHEHGDLSICPPLVIAQFSEPGVAPVLGTLCLPKNGPGHDPRCAVNQLNDVAATGALGNRLNRVIRQSRLEKVLQLHLLNLALKLLRALLSLSLQLLNSTLHRSDLLIS